MTKIYFIFSKDLNVSPSELDEMFWYDVIYMLKEYENYVKESNEESERQQKEYEAQQPEIPTFKQPQMPQINVPSIDSISKGFKF